MELFDEVVPKTVENFRQLVSGEKEKLKEKTKKGLKRIIFKKSLNINKNI